MSDRERIGPTPLMQEAFRNTAKCYVGTAIFAPTMKELALAMGLRHPLDISAYSRGLRYPHVLKALSGKDVVHRGFVLGDLSSVGGEIVLPELESLEATEARAVLDSLSDDEKQKLVSELSR